MSDKDIIDQLTKEVSDLKLELANLHRMLKQESDSSTKHISEIYKRIRDINNLSVNNISTLYDMVTPIEQKIFPEISRARQQLGSILEKSESDSGDAQGKKQ